MPKNSTPLVPDRLAVCKRCGITPLRLLLGVLGPECWCPLCSVVHPL